MMAFSNRFVMVVMHNGHPLQERSDGTVHIPFGAEYSLRFKNKNSRRALVKFFIDGENVSGNGYIMGAYGSRDDTVEIERRSECPAKFKFVALDSEEAQLEGKNGPNMDGSKGVIEARFYLEKKVKKIKLPKIQPVPMPYPVPYPVNPWRSPYYPVQPLWSDNTLVGGGYVYGSNTLQDGGTVRSNVSHTVHRDSSLKCCVAPPAAPMNLEASPIAPPAPAAVPPVIPAPEKQQEVQEGVTVDGSYSSQTFHTVAFEAETDYVTLKLVLRGIVGTQTLNPQVAPAGTEVDYCTNCGQKKGRKADRFCGKCGHKFS